MDCSHQTWAGGGPAEIVADVAGVLMSSGRREPFRGVDRNATAEGEGCMQTTDRAEEWLMA